MTIVVIHGPDGTGKTFHAEAFAEHYTCTNIVDDVDQLPVSSPFPRNWSLILTSCEPDTIRDWQRRAHPHPFDQHRLLFVHITVARTAIGVDPLTPAAVERLSR